jgi:hypothetical protein
MSTIEAAISSGLKANSTPIQNIETALVAEADVEATLATIEQAPLPEIMEILKEDFRSSQSTSKQVEVRHTPLEKVMRTFERFLPTYDEAGVRDRLLARNLHKLKIFTGDAVNFLDDYRLIPHFPISEDALNSTTPISHTHWDREWHNTLAETRPLLENLMTTTLDLCQKDSEFKMELDGQVSLVYDWLSSLPEDKQAEEITRISNQIQSGRLVLGSLYTAGDIMLSSGEQTLRNIGFGRVLGRKLGHIGEIGHFPDQFGLPASLPKMCALMGIKKILVQRGKNPDLPQRLFWESDDGSKVEVFFIENDYFHSKQNPTAIRNVARKGNGLANLFMAGYDHQIPRAELTSDLREAGIGTLSTFRDFFNSLEPLDDSAPTHKGELRDVGKFCILPDVISNRVDIRKLFAVAEVMIERSAEPLSAFGLIPYPDRLLNQAWFHQNHNQAHDSKYLSVKDEVASDVEARVLKAISIAKSIEEKALTALGLRMRNAGRYVLNLSNFDRSFYIENKGLYFRSENVPALGWAKLKETSEPVVKVRNDLPDIRFCKQIDRGDSYTFDPRGKPKIIEIPMTQEVRPGEAFTRVGLKWNNIDKDQRTRMLIKLPKPAIHSLADAPFGSVERPAVLSPNHGRDKLTVYPAQKFILAGGLAVLVDRVTEYEILPGTNELAITIVRSHGALSVGHPKYRQGGAGPRIATAASQVQKEIVWDFAIMPWNEDDGLPSKQWEQFALAPRLFTSEGGGNLPPSGSIIADPPKGVLSAIFPSPDQADEVIIRTFTDDERHTIVHHRRKILIDNK